jgi:hypothetical protein
VGRIEDEGSMATKTRTTTKERLHKLVDELDDARAEALLTLLKDETARSKPPPGKGPTSADDPLWKLVDLIDPEIDVPGDVSSDIHRYVADAIESEWKG